jgi:DNA-binding SARP family transcriptional activator/ATP/maltotriose-dependent transcriptional regulator MalT
VRAATIIAPSGYGKSMLAEEVAERRGHATAFVELTQRAGRNGALFVAALRRALRGAGLRSLADAMSASPAAEDRAALSAVQSLVELIVERDDQLLIVVDEVQFAQGSAAAALAELVNSIRDPHAVLLAGQALPRWDPPPQVDATLGAGDLSFDAGEVAELSRHARRALDASEVDTILTATGGWPAAVALAIDSGFTDASSVRSGIAVLLERVLASAEPETRSAVRSLAALPLLSASVAETVAGPGSLARFESLGIPLRQRSDGWFVLPEPIRHALMADTTEGSALSANLTAAAGAYFAAGHGQTALSMLLERSAHEEVAATLEGRRWQELQEFDPVELRSVLSVLPAEVVDAHPKLLLVIARAANAAGELEWRGSLLDRAAASATQRGDARLGREIDADRAGVAAMHGEIARTTELARAVLDSATSDEAATRARALAALGRVEAFAREPETLADARQHLTDAATLARLAGEHELLAATLQGVGYNVYFAEGDMVAARRSLEAAAEAAPQSGRARAGILTFLSDVLMYSGDLDSAEAVLREVADVGHRLRDHGLLGYHDWMKAAIASRRGDSVALETWLADAERHPGDWFRHPTGIEFLAEAVDFLGRVGQHDRAARYVERVRERVAADEHDDVDQIELYARAVHAARAGDPAAAEADLAAVLETEQLPPREAWRMHLLRGLAALRGGDEASAARHAARAFEEAAALGHPELPQIHEPYAVEQLLPLARRARSPAAETVAEAEPVLAVRVLGGFSVTTSGRPSEPPPGRPATLVKLLALSGGPMAADEVVEALWPEIDPETGRARLRNVLARIRAACGELIRRDGSALVLAPGVVVDAADFERDARSALNGGEAGAALAQRAVSRYAGELLPGDRYEDFTAVSRERLSLLYIGLLDRLAQGAERAGDVDEALRLYNEAIAAAPVEEHRYEAAAALALKHGRRQRALEVIDRAQRMLDDLGVPMSDALSAIAARSEFA